MKLNRQDAKNSKVLTAKDTKSFCFKMFTYWAWFVV